MWVWHEEVETIVYGEQHGDDEGLRDFDAVYACENIDAVGAEYGDGEHVYVV